MAMQGGELFDSLSSPTLAYSHRVPLLYSYPPRDHLPERPFSVLGRMCTLASGLGQDPSGYEENSDPIRVLFEADCSRLTLVQFRPPVFCVHSRAV